MLHLQDTYHIGQYLSTHDHQGADEADGPTKEGANMVAAAPATTAAVARWERLVGMANDSKGARKMIQRAKCCRGPALNMGVCLHKHNQRKGNNHTRLKTHQSTPFKPIQDTPAKPNFLRPCSDRPSDEKSVKLAQGSTLR